MTTAQVGYLPVHRWVKQVLGSTHTTVVVTVAWAVLCLLVAQRVTAAALARALPAEHAGSGRSCLRRVRRWWSGPALDQATISPARIRLALTLLAAEQPVLVALDTTRLGAWEVWLAGIVIAGRTLPIGWAVIPYPCPRGASGPRRWRSSSHSSRPSQPEWAGRWSRTAAFRARCSLPSDARVARTSACGGGGVTGAR
jgi:hypothetical protein